MFMISACRFYIHSASRILQQYQRGIEFSAFSSCKFELARALLAARSKGLLRVSLPFSYSIIITFLDPPPSTRQNV